LAPNLAEQRQTPSGGSKWRLHPGSRDLSSILAYRWQQGSNESDGKRTIRKHSIEGWLGGPANAIQLSRGNKIWLGSLLMNLVANLPFRRWPTIEIQRWLDAALSEKRISFIVSSLLPALSAGTHVIKLSRMYSELCP
jgi:hypothetical protein